MSYKKLWKQIIRPPRYNYSIEQLGDKDFRLAGKLYQRTDLEFFSIKGEKIYGSHFEPIESRRISPIMPCVIYVHGNSSCRLEALDLTFVLTGNMTLFTFDFPGCGMSEGKYISLGWYEQHDLANIIEFIRYERRVGKIALWGRSMGAVTTILYCSNNSDKINALILDSPFSKFKQLALDLAKSHCPYIPSFVLKVAYKFIRNSIKNKIGADIEDLKPVKVSHKFEIPTFFIYSVDDELIPPTHFAFIQSNLRNVQEVRVLNGGHNDVRPNNVLKSVGRFLVQQLGVDKLVKEPQNIPLFMIANDGDEQIRQLEEFSKHNERNEDIESQMEAAADMYYRTIPRFHDVLHK